MLTRRRSERGSMAVEFAIAAPAFVLLLLLVAGGAEWVTSSSEVGAAARDAVRAASFARSGAQAVQYAQEAANDDLKGICTGGRPVVTVTPLDPGFANAAQVKVVVSCRVNLDAFKLVGLDTTSPFVDTAVAPLDPYEHRA